MLVFYREVSVIDRSVALIERNRKKILNVDNTNVLIISKIMH